MTECLSAQSCAQWLHYTAGDDARLCLDSRQLEAGDVFVALQGARFDGLSFAPVAAARRASCILCDRREDARHKCAGLAFAEVENLHAQLGPIASLYYGNPSAAMRGVAITGTNGKTSTSHWTAALLTRLGMPAAAIGTVGTFLQGRQMEAAGLTTPDAATLQLTFKKLVQAHAQAFALEASSIGLVRHRLDGTTIETAVFTNLTRDHLDYHKTLEEYERSKALLFEWPTLKNAVINADDAAGRRLIERARQRGLRTIVTSLYEDCVVPDCEMLVAQNIRQGEKGMLFELLWQGRSHEIRSHVFGRFNVSNLLETAAAALSLGFDVERVCRALEQLQPPAGRMQSTCADDGLLAVVDYAHTPDALEKVLAALRETAKERGGKLLCVFGAGGDRDAGKRPLMGEAASRLADRCVITSDNPRSEDPRAIAEAVAAGVEAARRDAAVVMLDRREAIVQTVCEADARDVVLIAGKGHETYQEIAGVRHHFDDLETAREAFNERRVRRAKQ